MIKMKTLIIYYSDTGKTKTVSKTLAEELNADIIEIKDATQKKGLLTKIGNSIDAFREKKTKIKPEKINIDDYSLIYIGTPTWASNPTPAIITLIDRLQLKNKDVIIFTTLNNNGGENTLKRMNEKIKLRGGRVISEFKIKTKDKTLKGIQNETKKIIKTLDLNIYS